MLAEDTEISTEVIVDAVTSGIQEDVEDRQGSSSEFESISSSPGLHKLVLLVRICNYQGSAVDPSLFTQNEVFENYV